MSGSYVVVNAINLEFSARWQSLHNRVTEFWS
jgi:hypothetical protein